MATELAMRMNSKSHTAFTVRGLVLQEAQPGLSVSGFKEPQTLGEQQQREGCLVSQLPIGGHQPGQRTLSPQVMSVTA